MLTEIGSIIANCDSGQPNIRPTEVYNEGWMLKLVLNWFYKNIGLEHDSKVKDILKTNPVLSALLFSSGSRWYSEALLGTQFKKIPTKGRSFVTGWNKLSESHTNADGIIGHFEDFGSNENKGELVLCSNASQFVVLEAKMSSKLSEGVSHATYYNQAARNVACMAEVSRLAKIDDFDKIKLGFYVIAPQQQINKTNKKNTFKEYTEKGHIKTIVHRRIDEYQKQDAYERIDEHKDMDDFEEYFKKFINKVECQVLSWEQIIEFIRNSDPCYGTRLNGFYGKCKKFNGLV